MSEIVIEAHGLLHVAVDLRGMSSQLGAARSQRDLDETLVGIRAATGQKTAGLHPAQQRSQRAVIQLEDVHLAQAINYLEAYGLEVGLLLNFGSRSLQFKRVMKPTKNRPPKS